MNEIAAAILAKNKYAVLSTVREDGAPWATPIHFAYDDSNIYWLSNDDTVHSINIARDNRVFLTIFNSNQISSNEMGDHGALYLATYATRLGGVEATEAKAIFERMHPDGKSHKLGDWSAFRAPIGEINPAKTVEDRIYCKYFEGAAR